MNERLLLPGSLLPADPWIRGARGWCDTTNDPVTILKRRVSNEGFDTEFLLVWAEQYEEVHEVSDAGVQLDLTEGSLDAGIRVLWSLVFPNTPQPAATPTWVRRGDWWSLISGGTIAHFGTYGFPQARCFPGAEVNFIEDPRRALQVSIEHLCKPS